MYIYFEVEIFIAIKAMAETPTVKMQARTYRVAAFPFADLTVVNSRVNRGR